MKCANVQSLIVEYAEGALGPADEMCIDIHLIQCEECRAELTGLRDLLGAVARGVHSCTACDDAVEFLDRFHAMAAAESPQPAGQSVSPWGRLPVLRLTSATIAVLLAFSSALLTRWSAAGLSALGTPVAEARVREVSEADWSPYLRGGLDLRDLKVMGLVGEIEPRPAPGAD